MDAERKGFPWRPAAIPIAALLLGLAVLLLRGGAGTIPPLPPRTPAPATTSPGSLPPAPPPGAAVPSPAHAPAGSPSAVRPTPVSIRGRLVERGGYPPHPRLLVSTVVEGVREGKPDRASRVFPGDGGVFALSSRADTLPSALSVSVGYSAEQDGKWLINEVARKTVPVPAPLDGVSDLGDVTLPESDRLSWLEGTAFSSSGKAIVLDEIALESEQPVNGGIIRLASPRPQIGNAPNAPAGYFRGNAFAVHHAPPGRYRLTLSADGHWTSAREIELVAGQGVPGLTVLMDETPFALRGFLRDKATGLPLAGVDVSLFGPPGPAGTGEFLGETTSGADGSYWLSLRSRPKEGDLSLRLAKDGYASLKIPLPTARLRPGFALPQDARMSKNP